MKNENLDGGGLTEEGAKRLIKLFDEEPKLRNKLGKTTWVDRMHHSTNLTELYIEDIKNALYLPKDVMTGKAVAELLPNVAAGFDDYGANKICLDVAKIEAIARRGVSDAVQR